MTVDIKALLAEAQNPATTASRLQELVALDTRLWPSIASHPNLYPALQDYLKEYGNDQVKQTLAARTDSKSSVVMPLIESQQPEDSAVKTVLTTGIAALPKFSSPIENATSGAESTNQSNVATPRSQTKSSKKKWLIAVAVFFFLGGPIVLTIALITGGLSIAAFGRHDKSADDTVVSTTTSSTTARKAPKRQVVAAFPKNLKEVSGSSYKTNPASQFKEMPDGNYPVKIEQEVYLPKEYGGSKVTGAGLQTFMNDLRAKDYPKITKYCFTRTPEVMQDRFFSDRGRIETLDIVWKQPRVGKTGLYWVGEQATLYVPWRELADPYSCPELLVNQRFDAPTIDDLKHLINRLEARHYNGISEKDKESDYPLLFNSDSLNNFLPGYSITPITATNGLVAQNILTLLKAQLDKGSITTLDSVDLTWSEKSVPNNGGTNIWDVSLPEMPLIVSDGKTADGAAVFVYRDGQYFVAGLLKADEGATYTETTTSTTTVKEDEVSISEVYKNVADNAETIFSQIEYKLGERADATLPRLEAQYTFHDLDHDNIPELLINYPWEQDYNSTIVIGYDKSTKQVYSADLQDSFMLNWGYRITMQTKGNPDTSDIYFLGSSCWQCNSVRKAILENHKITTPLVWETDSGQQPPAEFAYDQFSPYKWIPLSNFPYPDISVTVPAQYADYRNIEGLL